MTSFLIGEICAMGSWKNPTLLDLKNAVLKLCPVFFPKIRQYIFQEKSKWQISITLNNFVMSRLLTQCCKCLCV